MFSFALPKKKRGFGIRRNLFWELKLKLRLHFTGVDLVLTAGLIEW